MGVDVFAVRRRPRRLLQRVAEILVPGGRLLFTSPTEPVVWNDAMTGIGMRSLGAEEYRRQLSALGLSGQRCALKESHVYKAASPRHAVGQPSWRVSRTSSP